jgi:hypothetical protein
MQKTHVYFKALKQHFNALEMYFLSFKVIFKVIFGVQKLYFGLECQRFDFFVFCVFPKPNCSMRDKRKGRNKRKGRKVSFQYHYRHHSNQKQF